MLKEKEICLFCIGEEEYIEMFGKMIYEMTGHYRDFIFCKYAGS